MKSCCQSDEALARTWTRQAKTLRAVLFINAIMFLAELGVGVAASSVAVLADSLDMLGDALVYGFSLYVVGRSRKWRAGAALLKGCIMLLFAMGVLAEIVWKLFSGQLPTAPLMGVMGIVALVANGMCLFLLTRHRADDINMRSTWICSRNDILANVGVLLAAAVVHWTTSIWPDVLVSAVITGLFVWSAADILSEAWHDMHENTTAAA